VIPFFQKLRETGTLPITDERMTRFTITLDEGVNLVFMALKKMWGGEIFIPKIPSYNIVDIAKAVAPECELKVVGIRPGEKLHEEMITETDSLNTVEFEKYFVILPSASQWDFQDFIKKSDEKPGKMCEFGFAYNSSTNVDFHTIEELKTLVKDNCSEQ
jgi:FlaA1/EpsC-like NDP-sugar epimerase